jgi:glycosyltransferase involved in cell wall biosynthesis
VLSEQAEIPGIQEAGGGFVVPLEAGAIRGAIATALEGSAELGAAARAHVLAQHGREAVVRRLEQYLQAITA